MFSFSFQPFPFLFLIGVLFYLTLIQDSTSVPFCKIELHSLFVYWETKELWTRFSVTVLFMSTNTEPNPLFLFAIWVKIIQLQAKCTFLVTIFDSLVQAAWCQCSNSNSFVTFLSLCVIWVCFLQWLMVQMTIAWMKTSMWSKLFFRILLIRNCFINHTSKLRLEQF